MRPSCYSTSCSCCYFINDEFSPNSHLLRASNVGSSNSMTVSVPNVAFALLESSPLRGPQFESSGNSRSLLHSRTYVGSKYSGETSSCERDPRSGSSSPGFFGIVLATGTELLEEATMVISSDETSCFSCRAVRAIRGYLLSPPAKPSSLATQGAQRFAKTRSMRSCCLLTGSHEHEEASR